LNLLQARNHDFIRLWAVEHTRSSGATGHERYRKEAEQNGTPAFVKRYIERLATEGPQHQVTLAHPFYLAVHEVTRKRFRRFVQDTDYKTEAERDGRGGQGWLNGVRATDPRFVWDGDQEFTQTDDHPVLNVTWNDAIAFCRWLSDEERTGYQLPTELPWEFACRSGNLGVYGFGDDSSMLRQRAWFDDNSGGRPHVVAQKLANSFGLYDMHGNVWEWCRDRFVVDDNNQSPPDGTQQPSAGSHRVVRGGSWLINARRCRSAYRDWRMPTDRSGSLGFRVVTDVPTKEADTGYRPGR
jgi:formylglycine-generating enzyme required for sulfatase activity